MTPEQLESVYKHDDLTLEVIRESGNAKWLNRYIQNPETKVHTLLIRNRLKFVGSDVFRCGRQ